MKGDEKDKDTVGREENGEEIGEIYNIRGSPYMDAVLTTDLVFTLTPLKLKEV